MGLSKHRRFFLAFAIAIGLGAIGCSLLAPSDEELMGGLTKTDEAGAEGGDGASRDARIDSSPPIPCDAGASGASCTSDTACCSGKCKGNGQCL